MMIRVDRLQLANQEAAVLNEREKSSKLVLHEKLRSNAQKDCKNRFQIFFAYIK